VHKTSSTTQIILATNSQQCRIQICSGKRGGSGLRLGGSGGLTDPTVFLVTWWYLYLTPSLPTVIFFLRHSFSKQQAFSLPSSSSPTPLLKSLWFLEGFLALESVRKLEKILLLYSCALGEALAAWCVRYSWSLAPRWLAVARELPIRYGWAPGSLYYPCEASGTI
jgi:hypothetical protein